MPIISSRHIDRSANIHRVSCSSVSVETAPRSFSKYLVAWLFFSTMLLALPCFAQDWIRTGTGLGVEKVRLASADFKPSTQDPNNANLLKTFNETLWNDLDNAGIFDMVSKSFYPIEVPGNPAEVRFEAWNAPPPNASMLAFGDLGATGNSMIVHGWLYDVKNVGSPQVLGKQYTDAATPEAARTTAHKFANEIIFRLGGGVPGIAESKIFFVSDRSGHKEIWAMDYDGSNQHQVTHLGTISLSPRISPDGSRVAFSSLGKSSWEIMMYSVELDRVVSFPKLGGTNLSPTWSPDGTKLAFSSSRGGQSNIYVMDAAGTNSHRLTTDRGPDVGPTFNRKTGAQIAFVSGQSGLPQVYTMEADGTNMERELQEPTIFTSWISPANSGSSLPTMVDATISHLGPRTTGTSCFSPAAPAANKYGPCWPMAPKFSS